MGRLLESVSFIGINACFIDEKWEKCTIVLRLLTLVGRHTGKMELPRP